LVFLQTVLQDARFNHQEKLNLSYLITLGDKRNRLMKLTTNSIISITYSLSLFGVEIHNLNQFSLTILQVLFHKHVSEG
jgi:hypothetical protein